MARPLRDAVDGSAAGALLVSHGDALERVSGQGDLFAPVLTTVQCLPER